MRATETSTDAVPPVDAHAATAEESPDDEPSPPRRRLMLGIRARILFWSVLTLAVTVAMAVLAVRAVLIGQVDGRIEEGLRQEAEEMALLADEGIDPETGEPFGADVERIFEVFLDRNVPQRNEAYLTFVSEEPYRRTLPMVYRLDRDEPFLERVHDVRETERDSYETPAGRVEYLAVPLTLEGRQRGVFVAAYFRDVDADDVARATTAAAEVGLLMLLIGSVVIWRVAESVLRPVRRTSDTVREITSADLTRRLPVSGNDEVADLGRTFNDLLTRLEEAFETQRRFVDDAGHELRTPITIIRGHLELLDDDPAERERTLALVVDELGRMQRIVEDLLTLAKAERPDFLSLDAVDLSDITDELVDKVRTLGDRDWIIDARARGIVVADRQRLSQAVIQLAQNAVQHTDPDATIALGSELRGHEARLWVRDTGHGIAPEEIDRIFRRFARAGRRRASDGAGLGLAIVRAIADAHGGRVEVVSAIGAGSTFTLIVPIDQPVEPAEDDT